MAQQTKAIESHAFANLATSWRHLRWLQIWPTGLATCPRFKFDCIAMHCLVVHCTDMPHIMSYKSGHQVAPLAVPLGIALISSPELQTIC